MGTEQSQAQASESSLANFNPMLAATDTEDLIRPGETYAQLAAESHRFMNAAFYRPDLQVTVKNEHGFDEVVGISESTNGRYIRIRSVNMHTGAVIAMFFMVWDLPCKDRHTIDLSKIRALGKKVTTPAGACLEVYRPYTGMLRTREIQNHLGQTTDVAIFDLEGKVVTNARFNYARDTRSCDWSLSHNGNPQIVEPTTSKYAQANISLFQHKVAQLKARNLASASERPNA